MKVNRRTFFGLGATVPATLQAGWGWVGEPPLRERATAKKLLFGAAAAWPALQDDEEYAKHFAQECNLLVQENVLKMQRVRPTPDTYVFEPADFMATFCKKNGMKMRGHTLVWHRQMAPWFDSVVTKENAGKIFDDHIRRVAGQYRGQMHSWDVVNEAIEVKDGLNHGMRKTPWLDLLGPEYVERAFRVAHEADPGAMLYYNDYGLDYAEPADEVKRAAVLALLRRLLDKKVPVRGLGTQAHLNASRLPKFKAEILKRFLGDVAALGLNILITELDVIDKDLPDDIEARDRAVAQMYEAYLLAALEEKAVVGIVTWGLTDKYTWLAGREKRASGTPVRVLPLDDRYERKRAWHAIASAIDARQQ